MSTTHPQQSVPEKKGITGKHVRVFFLLLVVGLAVLIIAKNARPVTFWLFKEFENTSLIVLMLISLALGAILAWVLLTIRASRRKEITRLRGEVKRLQEELKRVR